MKNQGFTVIELLVVVSIIGILSLSAYNMYGNAQIKSRIAEGKSAISAWQLEAEAERLKTRKGYDDNSVFTPNTRKVYYNKNYIYEMQTTSLTKNTYIIRATAQGNWLPANHSCSIMQLNEKGTLTPESC